MFNVLIESVQQMNIECPYRKYATNEVSKGEGSAVDKKIDWNRKNHPNLAF